MTTSRTPRTLRAHGTPVLTTWLVRYTVSKRAPGGAWTVVREGEVAANAHTAAQATVLAERYLKGRMAVEQAADRTGAEWALVTAGPTTLTLVRESDFDDAPLQATLDALAQGGNRLADSLASLLDEATRRGYEDAVETELFQIASALDKQGGPRDQATRHPDPPR